MKFSSLFLAVSLHQDSLNRRDIFYYFLSYFIISFPFPVHNYSVCCEWILWYTSTLKGKKTIFVNRFSVTLKPGRRRICTHKTTHKFQSMLCHFELMPAVCTLKCMNWEWTLHCLVRVLSACGEGEEKEEAERLLWR